MEHSHYEGEVVKSEYLVPLSGDGSGPLSPPRNPSEYNRPTRRTPKSRYDEEQPSIGDLPWHPQGSARAQPHYAGRIPPTNYSENRARQPSRDAHAIAFGRSESGSSNDTMEIFPKPVGHDGLSDKKIQGTQRKRLMFDGSIQNIPPSSGKSLSQYSNDKQSDFNGGGNSLQDGEIEPIVIWNITLPLGLTRLIKQPPSLQRISVFVVQVAPCFLCCGNSVHSGSTDRAVLTRLNMLCLFFTFSQVFVVSLLAIFLLIIDDDPGVVKGFDPHFWNLNGLTIGIGVLAIIIIVICFCTIRVIREVDLVGVIRYLWAMLWIVPFEVFFNISLFDYFNVTSVWIRHWWSRPQLSWFRGYFCPGSTGNTLCALPIMGGADFENEEAWCIALYNTTDCGDIRDKAQDQMIASMLTYYTILAVIGCFLLFIMLLMVNSLERIITKPIVQKSRETNVPAWLLLPTVGNALAGWLFLFSPSSLLSSRSGAGAENSWIGSVYLATAVLFCIAMLTGWLLSSLSIQDNVDKKRKNVAVIVFIIVMATNTVLLVTLFVASLVLSAALLESPIDEADRGEIACYVDQGGSCTGCGDSAGGTQCPEWTLDEVTNILQTQLKQSATIAMIFFLYCISVLRFGFVLRKHLSLYQIDYV